MNQPTLAPFAENIWADPASAERLGHLGLTTLDAVFAFDAGQPLVKSNLSSFRSRLRIEQPRTKPST